MRLGTDPRTLNKTIQLKLTHLALSCCAMQKWSVLLNFRHILPALNILLQYYLDHKHFTVVTLLYFNIHEKWCLLYQLN